MVVLFSLFVAGVGGVGFFFWRGVVLFVGFCCWGVFGGGFVVGGVVCLFLGSFFSFFLRFFFFLWGFLVVGGVILPPSNDAVLVFSDYSRYF